MKDTGRDPGRSSVTQHGKLPLARRAFRYLRPHAGGFALGQVATLIATAGGLVFPLVARTMVDNLVEPGSGDGILPVLSLLGLVFAVMMISGFFRDLLLGRVSQFITRDLRQHLFERLQVLTISYYERTRSGEIVSVLTNDINRFQESISQGLVFVLTQFITLFAVTGLLIRIDPVLTLVLVAMVPLVVVTAAAMGRRSRNASRSVQERLGNVTSILSEVVRGIDVIKTFMLGRFAVSMFRKENDRVTGDSLRVIRIKATNGLLIGSIGAAFLLTILGVGGAHVASGRMSVGDLVAYLIYVQMIVGPLGMLSGIWMDVQKAFAAAERVFAVLDSEPEPSHGLAALPEEPNGNLIEFRDVTFAYGDGEPVLKSVGLGIARGETVALAGPSGAGKSSIIKLLLRFYPVGRGSIAFRGRDIDDYDLAVLRREMAVVMQDTHLFDMTVAENLLCGNPSATEQEMIDAARRASAHEFICALPAGYETRIGENGVTLSGGQRQRLAIARAFLKDPSVLLLDEATSSLDTESERAVHGALRQLMEGRTTLIVSHRLSTIRNADRIYVVDNGEITSAGTHTELRRSCPVYSELCEAQEMEA